MGSFSRYYFWYFAAVGAFLPFCSLWLASEGASADLIAFFNALFRVTNILAPPLWLAWVARRHSSFGWPALTGLAAFVMAGMAMLPDPAVWLTGAFVFGVAFHAILPQAEGLTLQALGPSQDDYGRIRVWGSIGYAIIVVLMGAIVVDTRLSWVPWITALVLLAAALEAYFSSTTPSELPLSSPPPPAPRPGRHLRLWALLGFSVLIQASFAIYYVFFSWHLSEAGMEGTGIGVLLAIAVGAEIAAFWLSPYLLSRLSPERWLLIAALLTLGRWLVTAFFPEQWEWLTLAQLTHAFGYALTHAACIRLLSGWYPSSLSWSMGWLNALGFGAGGVLGSLLGGWWWKMGGGSLAFVGAACLMSVACLFIVPMAIRPQPVSNRMFPSVVPHAPE